jgi:hypothetical protein
MFIYDETTRMSRPSYTNLSIRTVNFLLHIMFVYNIYIDLVVLLERVDGSFGARTPCLALNRHLGQPILLASVRRNFRTVSFIWHKFFYDMLNCTGIVVLNFGLIVRLSSLFAFVSL